VSTSALMMLPRPVCTPHPVNTAVAALPHCSPSIHHHAQNHMLALTPSPATSTRTQRYCVCRSRSCGALAWRSSQQRWSPSSQPLCTCLGPTVAWSTASRAQWDPSPCRVRQGFGSRGLGSSGFTSWGLFTGWQSRDGAVDFQTVGWTWLICWA
jgi:hypothetical protein